MTDRRYPDDEPIRLVDEDDRSLTLVNNHVDGVDENGRSDTRDLELTDEEREREPVITNFQEETAVEYGVMNDRVERDETAMANQDDVTAGRGVGTFAIVLSILSLFFLPILLGAAGIVVGFVSRRNGSTALGNWAIGIGAISILMTVFFSPFF
ncbi:DUF4190 domain-containing protein [Halalkalibacter akibai]|uniref:DUF4190 domain-containing protein n=1 Tax=Halalkalibacter akibai (strain ATCC 43226 / DSM 21942 / CIP 109018 / JCM 9157 / 1139) TaxID=1236973 RepID=W4QQ38_HALA3|nr:DUF4190 domain-containing protein [Halalkalibacter akibai]GAE33434.1 hypothetical protein JCM9157_434 [Halalkalibacter akibai JCM 9157]